MELYSLGDCSAKTRTGGVCQLAGKGQTYKLIYHKLMYSMGYSAINANLE
jgi:hypothetical protein